ncbi:MAG TPA: endolytic transglycosylase MltG [Candidatus Saccharimonadales bacterium]|nr:endolytic transglycosylase MltG [Candidatus Saccharimonadales bacterium]
MVRYGTRSRHPRVPRRIWMVLVVLIIVSIAGVITARHKYDQYMQPVSSNPATQIFTVEPNSSVKQIAKDLEEARLIRSAWAFQLYVQRKDQADQLQAGTYALSPSADTPAIVKTLTVGRVATKLVTILPGRRIDQVRADLINDGFAPAAVDRALDPTQYGDLPALAFKPANVTTLEGLLWPDSYQKQPDTDPSVIIRESLKAMGQRLTPDVQAGFAAQGLTPYQGLILASVILQEVGRSTDQGQVAQVFLTRLKTGMKLESDPTARYGAIQAGKAASLSYDSPYNTYLHAGLPPTPISTVNASSLAAAWHPAATNWLFFVAGDDGSTYFSKTHEEHQALTKKYCHKLCGN